MSVFPIAVFYEHPTWFTPLFAELERRGIPFEPVPATEHVYDPNENEVPYSLVVNRASPSAYTRGNGRVVFHTLGWLRHLERRGTPVVNGTRAYELEISKARQLDLLKQLGLSFPASRVINDPLQAPGAADELRFPVVVKPNVGGSGAGIVAFESRDELAAAAGRGNVDLGPDGVALVQELIPLADGRITRVETLDGEFLYAINVYPGDSFNLCPADACRAADGRRLARTAGAADAPDSGMAVERATPPAAIVTAVERIARDARLDVGGIEYLIDARDGRPYFYDINALSNFVADAEALLGFDPVTRFVDYLERRIAAPVAV